MHRTLRNIHLCAGLFCAAYLLMYAASAVQMAHSSLFNNKPRTTESRVRVVPGLGGARAVARELMANHGVAGELNQVEKRDAGMYFRVVRPGTVYEALYHADSGEVEMKEHVAGFMGMLNRIHHVGGLWHEYWLMNVFGVYTGLVSLGLLVLSGTGIYLWFKLHRERRVGAVLLIATLGVTLPLIVAMRLA